MTDPIDWPCLKALRERFLSESTEPISDYWQSNHELSQYDLTFGERIAWKWDSVLMESLQSLHALQAARPTIFDWGAGTGRASRQFIHRWGAEKVSSVQLHDRSKPALEFARNALQTEFPGLDVSLGSAPPKSPYILLASHVLGELGNSLPEDLQAAIETADAVLWVEPGTPNLSRRLGEVREKLRARLTLVAPCPHQGICGLLNEGKSKDWCHHFTEPPDAIFHDAFWTRFSRELKIDLRALPVSYLVAAKSEWVNFAPKRNRIIGRVRPYKGYLQALQCTEEGVAEAKVLERQDKVKFKQLKRGGFSIEL